MLIKIGKGSGTQIQSVSRAARLLLWIASNRWSCTAKEAATATGMALPTVYHLLNTLVAEGLLSRDSDRRYGLGPQVGVLAFAYQQQLTVPEYLLQPLRRLAAETGETAYLADWRGSDIQVMAVEESNNALRVAWAQVGAYKNAHARAVGKALLAFASDEQRESYLAKNPPKQVTARTIWREGDLARELAEIRKRGFAYDQQEFLDGVSCVAAPIRQGAVVLGAYGLSVPNERFSRNIDRLTKAILDAARFAARHASEAIPARLSKGAGR